MVAPAGPYEPVEAVRVTVNGKEVAWPDATPFIDENNRTMVPLRAVGEAMGLYVDWDNDTRTAFFAKSYKDAGLCRVMSFTIDSNQATVRVMKSNTKERVAQKIITMDTSAVIVQDRTYAPIRFLVESFGFTVGWDNDTRTVIIATDSNYNVSTIDVQTIVNPTPSQGQQPSQSGFYAEGQQPSSFDDAMRQLMETPVEQIDPNSWTPIPEGSTSTGDMYSEKRNQLALDWANRHLPEHAAQNPYDIYAGKPGIADEDLDKPLSELYPDLAPYWW